MVLSQTAIYALKAVLHLAEADPAEPVRVDDIAKALDVPRNYLSKILHQLARDGILDSTRGPHGGFVLAIPPAELALGVVISPFDTIAEESACLLGRETCTDEQPCAAHLRWREVSRALQDFLKNTRISDLTEHGRSIEDLAVGSGARGRADTAGDVPYQQGGPDE
ncbi:MAG: RrF2 family transcriptional regulator [Gemmatimonadota bacterium]